VDVNRHIDEATFGNDNAAVVFHEYHYYVQQALGIAASGNRTVFFLDIHGQVGNYSSAKSSQLKVSFTH